VAPGPAESSPVGGAEATRLLRPREQPVAREDEPSVQPPVLQRGSPDRTIVAHVLRHYRALLSLGRPKDDRVALAAELWTLGHSHDVVAATTQLLRYLR
jgi:hypothetical protein